MPNLTPRERTRKRRLEAHLQPRMPPCSPLPTSALPALGNGTLQPATDRDVTAARAWEAHLDAGRIGVVPPPAPPAAELRLASLARILGQG